MKTIELTAEKQMLIDSKGNIKTMENKEALIQDISTNLAMEQGENPFNIEEGINYDEDILGKMGGIDYIKNQFINRIKDNEEIENISNIEIKNQDKVLKVNITINSIYGNINI